MFEDIIGKPDSPAYIKRRTCPYCKSYRIIKYGFNSTIDDKYTKQAKCWACGKSWFLIYNEDKSFFDIDLRKKAT